MLPMVQTEPLLFKCGGPSDEVAPTTATLPPSLTPDSDVGESVDIFYDLDVAVNTYSRFESCDLQPGDTWRGMQSKMSVTSPDKKNRKKSENKPQSQINKCNNEKKRRELENQTINQLEELLGTCLAEVKQPDKNGIVREATRQIEEVLKRRLECPEECPLRARLSPVQAGEVTSTQTQPAGLHYSELTTLIEALKHYTNSLGWVLLEINAKGEIECVTENIKDLIQHERTDLYKKSIFSLLHVNDHEKFSPLLRKLQTFGFGAGETEKFQFEIQARLIIKDSDGSDGSSHVDSLIHGAAVRGASEEAGSVMCVIRRSHDASAALLPLAGRPPPPPAPLAATHARAELIVFRLDGNFKVLSCDLSGVNLTGSRYLELIDSGDRIRVAAHLQEAPSFPSPPAVSEPFRLRIAPDKPWFRASASSLLFRAKPTSGESDFIMSTHTLLGDDDVELLESAAHAPRQAPGGPLMPSVANGEASGYQPGPPDRQSPGPINEFDFVNWASTFQLGEMPDEAKERKEAETPPARGPSAPPPMMEAPPLTPPEEPNRLRNALLNKNSNNILKELLKQDDEEATSSETSAPHTPHTPHTPHPPAAVSPLHAGHARAPQPPHLPPHPPHPQHPQHQQHHNRPEVLLDILKSDEDIDENRRNSLDGRNALQQSGLQSSALLSQLLSNTNGPSGNGRSQDHTENYMERHSAGMKRKFEDNKPPGAIKRVTPENQQVTSSAVSVASSSSSATATSPSTSAGMSPLCQKNQILVSLLARQQTTPTTPLRLPNQSLRPFTPAPRPRPPPPHPQHTPPQRHHHSTLSNILTSHNRASVVNGGAGAECGPLHAQSHLQMVLQGARAYPPASYAAHHIYTTQPSQVTQRAGGGGGDSEVPNDQTLSDILDEVIENMPDADRPQPDVNVLGDLEPNRQIRTDYAGVKEKSAMINAIRQSLMQCETVTKSPVSSSPAPPVYPVQSPQGTCSMGGGAGSGYALAAGDSARARALAEQQRARLLQMQRSQQMLVSPEAAEQTQDLGSTINALVSVATPPNVALQRTNDYHHLYHSPNQMGSNYGTNKITSSQQNPMLSRQLSGPAASGAYTHGGAAALHTPMTPQPYHRAPRPHLGTTPPTPTLSSHPKPIHKRDTFIDDINLHAYTFDNNVEIDT